jgi:hypothetical protein
VISSGQVQILTRTITVAAGQKVIIMATCNVTGNGAETAGLASMVIHIDGSPPGSGGGAASSYPADETSIGPLALVYEASGLSAGAHIFALFAEASTATVEVLPGDGAMVTMLVAA